MESYALRLYYMTETSAFFGEKMLKQSFAFLQTYDESKKLCETPEERRLFQTLDQRFMSDLVSEGEDYSPGA